MSTRWQISRFALECLGRDDPPADDRGGVCAGLGANDGAASGADLVSHFARLIGRAEAFRFTIASAPDGSQLQAGYRSLGMTGSVLPGFSNPEFPYGLSSVRGFPGRLASALGLARVTVEVDLVALLEA